MKKMILTVLAISLTLSTGCAEQFLEDNSITLTAEEPASTVIENNDIIPVVETSSEATDLFPFTVSPKDGVQLKSMYPLSYADATAEDVKTVSTYYDNLLQPQFYDIYIDMLNSGKYNKVYNALYDRTSHIYGKYADSSSYPDFGEYYYGYTYSPVYKFLKEEAFDYTAPSHISPILLSDKFFEFCADGLGLKTCRYSTDHDNRRLGTNDPYSVNITSYHSYDSRYDIESAVSGALDYCSFETSKEEDLAYVYIMDDNDGFFNIYAIYLKFTPEDTLYSIGIDYCSWVKDFFINADVLGKGLDYTPGVLCAEDVFVKNGFMELKNTLTKFLNSSTSDSTALSEENIQAEFDYTAYYTEEQHLGDVDEYYHIMAWYTLGD